MFVDLSTVYPLMRFFVTIMMIPKNIVFCYLVLPDCEIHMRYYHEKLAQLNTLDIMRSNRNQEEIG